jgi:hypothetical protein
MTVSVLQSYLLIKLSQLFMPYKKLNKLPLKQF